MANTNIYIKRSTSQDRPISLGAGEFGYSYKSNTLFIGTPDGTGVINVGGVLYTGMLDNATSSDTGNTLVKRDSLGNANFNEINANIINGAIYGNANTATKLETARNFEINGDDVESSAVSFDGTAGVVLQGNLKSTGVTSGTYGGTTKIPVITVDDKGRLSYAANVDVATSLSYAADTGTGSLDILTDTLTISGRDGISSIAIDANNTLLLDVDNTVIRTTGDQTITGSISISGNLHVTGNTFYTDVTTLNVADPLIYLAANNYSSDIVDIGFAGNYFDGSSQRHTGIVRIHNSNEMYAFTNYDSEFDENTLNIANPSLVLANLHASLTGGMVYGLANTINVVDGGTGSSSFNNGSILIGNGSGALQVLANTSYTQTGGFATNNTITAVQVDAYGRFTELTVEAISGLTVGQGGTGQTTFNDGSILVGNGSGGLQVLANSTYTQTGTLTSNNTITSITVDSYGRFTAATAGAISGLTVGQGGTGQSTFNTNGIVFGNGSGGLQVTAAAGVSDQTWTNQILTTTNSGQPVWASALDGGTF